MSDQGVSDQAAETATDRGVRTATSRVPTATAVSSRYTPTNPPPSAPSTLSTTAITAVLAATAIASPDCSAELYPPCPAGGAPVHFLFFLECVR